MSTHRPRPIDRGTAEQLLDGAPAALRAAGRLGARLVEARAAAYPEELIGEPAALAAYRSARVGDASEQRRRSMVKTALAKLLTVKALAILAGTLVGGAALAATTGVLPNPLTGPPASPAAPTQADPDGRGTPSPSLHGLCQAYAAGATANPGHAIDSPAFAALVAAAGGAENVDDYCATVVGNAGTPGEPGARPTTAGKPTSLPTPPVGGPPTDRPDAPAGLPPSLGHAGLRTTGAPTAVPSGSPPLSAGR